APHGHAIEVRVNAEDPENFFPSLGTVTRLYTPGGPGVRLDSVLYRGLEVTPHYDSMLGKLMVHADDRPAAIARMRRAVGELRIAGVTTSLPACLRVLADPRFRSGDYDTSVLAQVDRTIPEPVEELAALAAAVARYLGTERVGGADSAAPRGAGIAPWVLADRAERVGRRSW
ncbi:MAG: hypothetical protein H6837_15755, partial [Planctomycetes bacterium]|nr:hypothetical protein [Planctomycetota bacterium]